MLNGRNLNDHHRDRRRLLGCLTLTGGVLVLVYWFLYLSRSVDLGQDDPLVRTFESAFPLADTVFAVVLFAAAYHLFKGKRPGTFFLVMAGSMSLYLGVLDTTFYLGHGILSQIQLDAVIGLVINAMCIGGGIIALRHGWRCWSTSVRPSTPAVSSNRGGLRRFSTAAANSPHDLDSGETERDELLTEVGA